MRLLAVISDIVVIWLSMVPHLRSSRTDINCVSNPELRQIVPHPAQHQQYHTVRKEMPDDSSRWRKITDAVDIGGFEHLDVLVNCGPETSKLSAEPFADDSQPHATSASNIISASVGKCHQSSLSPICSYCKNGSDNQVVTQSTTRRVPRCTTTNFSSCLCGLLFRNYSRLGWTPLNIIKKYISNHLLQDKI